MRPSRLSLFLTLAAMLLASGLASHAQTGGTFCVTIEGIKQGKFKGEMARAICGDRIPGVRFSYQVSSPHDMATGQASGKRQHNPVVVTVEWGPATPQIFQAVATNEVLKSVVIEFIRTGATGVQEVYQTIRLTNATVSSVRMHVNEPQPGGPAENRALADVAFAFQRIEIENRPGKTMAADDWSR